MNQIRIGVSLDFMVTSKCPFSWELLHRLEGIAELRDMPWIVGGDFNEICFDSKNWVAIDERRDKCKIFEKRLNYANAKTCTVHVSYLRG